MMKRTFSTLLALIPLVIAAQSLTQPPSGGNQVSTVIQHIGLVQVAVTYSSPGVTAPNGTDRRGHVWGELVPFGMAPNGFGTASEIPWRAGANMNTVFSTSHDIQVEGERLPAGEYSIHMIPRKDEPWTVIFNKDIESWGSYYYDAARDQLRVEVEVVANEFHEDLTFSFEDRQQEHCLMALEWEELKVPVQLSVPNIHDLYIAQMTEDLKGSAGFTWQNWVNAANYCIGNNTHLEQGLAWADAAISTPFIGQKNFTTLTTKASVLMAMGDTDGALAVMDEAIDHPTAVVGQIHAFGRQLIAMGHQDKALEVFQKNADRFPDTWPVNVGLARGYSAIGDFNKALKYARKAQENVPEGDTLNANSLVSMIEMLENEEDVN